MPKWDGEPATSTPRRKSGYEGMDLPVPYKNSFRPNQRNADPPVGDQRDVLRYAQMIQFCGDLGSPKTTWLQGSQSPASPKFKAENPSGDMRRPETRDPKPGTMQPLINRSPVALWTGSTPEKVGSPEHKAT